MDQFIADLTEELKKYYGITNKPVTLVKAETELLIRLTTANFSRLGAQVRNYEKQPHHHMNEMNIQVALTDMALITSIAKKLRESEA